METVRLDKWLWAARFFKTRALAARACEIGRIELNAQPAKAAREVRAGQRLRVKCEAGEYEVEVAGLSETRGPASVAQALYRETEASQKARAAAAAERKTMRADGLPAEGKPSKRDRRDWERLRWQG